jgi:hypothetical protein
MHESQKNVIELVEVKEVSVPKSRPLQSIEIGIIKAIEDGYPLIHWENCLSREPIKALSQIKVTDWDLDKECTIAFVNGDLSKPVVMGLLYNPDMENEAPIVIQSDDAIILQSGASRIELHANGRINIQGLHINSQAYGPNKIKGASVKIN